MKSPATFFVDNGMGMKDVGLINRGNSKYLNLPSNSYGIIIIFGYTEAMSVYMCRALSTGDTEDKAILSSTQIILTPERNKIKIANNSSGTIRILVVSNEDFTLTA